MNWVVVENLSFGYSEKDVIFDGASLRVKKGEILCLLGENGSGKSTFLKIMANIIPCRFKLDFFEHYNTEVSKVIKFIGFVPDKPYLYDELTGEENIQFFLALFQEEKKKYLTRVKKLCQELRLEESLAKKVKHYSLGMKHKLFLAVSLARDIRLLLLDEPLITLDGEAQKYVIDKVRELAAGGMSVIFTSHIEELQKSLADRRYIIRDKKFFELCETR